MNLTKVAIFLATGYEIAEAIITVDLLRRAGIIVDLVSTSNKLTVLSKDAVAIRAEYIINNYSFSKCKAIILPGGSAGVANLMENEILKAQLISFANDKTKLIAAICAAPQLLGKLGLLNNKQIAFYPGCDSGLESAIKTNNKVVVSGNIITAKSVGCAFEFALKLIEILKNKTTKDLVVKQLEF